MFWDWPDTHSKFPPKWTVPIETLLLCLAERFLPAELGPIIVKFWGTRKLRLEDLELKFELI